MYGLSWMFTNPRFSVFPQPRQVESYTIEMRLHSLELACKGLWEFLKEKHEYTDDELAEVIREVAKRQTWTPEAGKEDKNICPNCGHKRLAKNLMICSWCGKDLPGEPF